jgi:hypothetical protein
MNLGIQLRLSGTHAYAISTCRITDTLLVGDAEGNCQANARLKPELEHS